METSKEFNFDEPCKFGLKIPLNHKYPIKTKQTFCPTTKQALELLPLGARYLRYYVGRKFHKKRPIMDYVDTISAQRMYGCPIGGIGGGTIGRGFKGEFCRFQLHPGIYQYVTAPACQFIVNIQNHENVTIFQSVLSTYEKPKKAPKSWEWKINGADCHYNGLYPRAWTTYDLSKYGVKLICRQISPVIPHNYKDSNLPCAVFVWSAKNVSNEQRNVSITFTWAEVLPNKKKPQGQLEIERYADESTCGVTLEQKIADTPCTFTIAKNKQEGESIHDGYCMFNLKKNSAYVWECLHRNGKLEPESDKPAATSSANRAKAKSNIKKSSSKKTYKCDAVGLSSTLLLDPGKSDILEFCLSWDMPVIKFRKTGKSYKRYYTKYFGADGIASASIAAYALRNYKNWEKELEEWQDPILNNRNIPDWLISALMNELYFIADGGTLWFDVRDEYPESDPRHHFGLFGYLEGHEYRMYNTYDVHFYASFALAQLWPNLQVVLQYMFRDAISVETVKTRKSLYDGKSVKNKVKNSVPHDLGDPEDDPFTKINAYNIHDVSEWRDLNTKFILQVMRDYRLLKFHSAPFGSDRYSSLEYIDDVLEGMENDLYARCTSQTHSKYSPINSAFTESSENDVAPSSTVDFNPDKLVEKISPVGNILEMLYRSDGEFHSSAVGGGEGMEEPVRSSGVSAWDARHYLADMYDTCVLLVQRMYKWDSDNDGLIENSGSPDQTYDTWVMSGPSAYCGGLWLATLCCVRAMAQLTCHDDDQREYDELLERARAAYENKLWCGSHYRFDTRSTSQRIVMAGQLAGQWFLHAAGFKDQIFPEDHVKTTLKTIYENNVLKFCEGRMGAVNGFVLGEGNISGQIDQTTIQSCEMWTGVTYGLSALMIYEGMHDEAFKTAGGMYSTLTQMGLSFETPEALYENGNHRSVAYMRPLAVWAMYQAITSHPPKGQMKVNTQNLSMPNGHSRLSSEEEKS